jgi:hypothetical protein
MLLAHPVVLRKLIEQYEALVLSHAEGGSHTLRQRMADVAYTLCISTDTHDIDAALPAARQLAGAGPHENSFVSTSAPCAALPRATPVSQGPAR